MWHTLTEFSSMAVFIFIAAYVYSSYSFHQLLVFQKEQFLHLLNFSKTCFKEMKSNFEKTSLETSKDVNYLLQNIYSKRFKNKGEYQSKVFTVDFKLQMWQPLRGQIQNLKTKEREFGHLEVILIKFLRLKHLIYIL